MKMKNFKISIIGAGFVGATTTYALMLGGLCEELVLVDVNKDKALGEAIDISQGAAFVKPDKVISGNYEDTDGSDIVIITAGAAQKPDRLATSPVTPWWISASQVPESAALKRRPHRALNAR